MINRIQLVILCAMLLSLPTASFAATMEQVAAVMGQLEGGYDRAKFLCLAAGIPMAPYAEHDPDLLKNTADLKGRYPDFFALATEKGIKQANNILSGTAQDLRDGCVTFSKLNAQKH